MKLEDPLAFRRVMDTFGFLPWLAISIAVVLPMFEFFCGVLLVLKVRSRAMVTAIGWLLLGFSIFVGWAALSGKWTECGCFGRLWLVGESPMAALGRNSFLLAVAWLVYRWQDE